MARVTPGPGDGTIGQMDVDDAGLVGAARAGDRAAFARLIERHRPLLVGTVRRMAGDGDLAEEAAQEAVLQAMLGLDRLREPSRFGPWLAGIGLNVCRHLLRRRPALPWLPEAAPADPQELAEAAEVVVRVREAVAALPAGQRRAVTLFYLAGLSQGEVAAALGIDVGAVKGRLHKARRALRARLVEFEEAEMTQSGLVEVRVVDVLRDEAKNVVVLEEVDGGRWLTVWIGPYEADFLAVHLEDLEMVRPLTYAFAARLLEAAGGRLEEVRISRLVEETYYAEVVVAAPGGATRTVDARPSDALNLAVLLGRPVKVAREVLDAVGRTERAEPEAETLSASGIVDELLVRIGSEHRAIRRRG
jgi:RNA polymerase sigma factor (sigma-70 family)